MNSCELDELSLQQIFVVGVNPSDPIRVQVKVDNCSLSMEVDMRTAVSIMSRSQQRSLLPGLLLNFSKVQCTAQNTTYLKKVREKGGTISFRIALGAACAVILKFNQVMLYEFGGLVQLNRH